MACLWFSSIGGAIGFVVGVLPGLDGLAKLALLLPFAHKVDEPIWNGLSLGPVVVGLFALPEIVDLAVRGTSIKSNSDYGLSSVALTMDINKDHLG